jgi:NADH dehydrogenase
MKRVVILGGGFAGATLAQRLEPLATRGDLEIVLLNRDNYFVFTPLLIEAGTGALEPRHAVVPLRDFLRRVTLRTAEVVGLDVGRRQVHYRVIGKEHTETLDWDHAVVALGSVTRQPPVPGLAEHGFELKDLPDAVALRDRAIRLLEQADATADPQERCGLLHFVVVGGNYSGVEVAGEFLGFVREAARAYRNLSPRECRVTLVEIAPQILPALDGDLARYARERLARCGADVLLSTSVREVAFDHVVLSDGRRLATRTVIWCAGIAPSPLLARLGLPLDAHGWLQCESDLRVRGHETVWGLGDCAVIPGPDGRPYPATAQHAVLAARHLAGNLERALAGRPTRPAVLHSRGALAALGCRTAVAKVFGLKLSGFPAWFLWRTVYLLKMPGWSRRLRVALDWTMGLLFPRAVVQLGIHRASWTQGTGLRE